MSISGANPRVPEHAVRTRANPRGARTLAARTPSQRGRNRTPLRASASDGSWATTVTS